MSSATVGLFTNTGGGGTAIQSLTACTVTSTSDANAANSQNTANGFTGSFVLASLPVANTLYFRIGTASGVAGTAQITLIIFPVP